MSRRCVLFDMDGTLFDSGIDFQGIRWRLDLPQNGTPILEQLQQAPPETRERGIELLHAAEAEGAARGTLMSGASELLEWLHNNDIACALVTNNSKQSVDVILSSHPLPLDRVFTREDAPAKPAPDLFLLAMKQLGCAPADAAIVGDTHLDAIAAHRAGIREIHLVSLQAWMAPLISADIDYIASKDLAEVRLELAEWLRR